MAPSPARHRGSLAAFRRPVVADLVFWLTALLALAVAGLAGGAVLVLAGVPDSALGWVWPALAAAVGFWLGFKLLAMGMNTARAVEEAPVVDDRRAASMEATGRAAGAALGRGTAALVKGRRKGARPTPPGAAEGSRPATEPAAQPAAGEQPTTPEVTVDRAARVLGSMVGRRLAERRKGEGS